MIESVASVPRQPDSIAAVPRGLRHLMLMAGVAGGLAVWRDRMLAANTRIYPQAARPNGQVTRR